MRVKLIVLRGTNSGAEVKIPTPKCIIGRGDDCHLRPKSDAISRRHCAILVKDSKVYVRDLKSRNGTYVNGEKIEGHMPLKGGEHLRVGPLEFEVAIDRSLGGEKKPVVRDVKDAAARLASSKSSDAQVSDWLDEADEFDRERRLTDPETRQFKVEDSTAIVKPEDLENEEGEVDAEADAEETKNQKEDKSKSQLFSFFKGSDKKKYGKLPKLPDKTTDTSRDAAADMLKKFFNRR